MIALSNKEKKKLFEILTSKYKIELDHLIKKENIFYDEKNNVYILNDEIIAFEKNREIYPTIFLISKYKNEIPYIIVNLGAKDKILNGADVFRPGIIEMSDFKKGDLLLIVSEDEKLLGIGIAVVDKSEAEKMEKGKIVETIHWFGDKITKLRIK